MEASVHLEAPGIDARKLQAHETFVMANPAKFSSLQNEISGEARQRVNAPPAHSAKKANNPALTHLEIRSKQRKRVRLYKRLRGRQEVLEQPNLWNFDVVDECIHEPSDNMEVYMDLTKSAWLRLRSQHAIQHSKLRKNPGKEEIVREILEHWKKDHDFSEVKADAILKNVESGLDRNKKKGGRGRPKGIRKGKKSKKNQRLGRFGKS